MRFSNLKLLTFTQWMSFGAWVYGVASILVMTYTFLWAYFSSEKAATIYINVKGEATLELILISIGMLCLIANGILFLVKYKTKNYFEVSN